MGGYGSGRQSQVNCTDDLHSIDVRQWQRQGLFEAELGFTVTWSSQGKTFGAIAGQTETGQVRLSYSRREHGCEWERFDYPVALQTMPCHYGGKRYWFTCPAVGCGKRVAKLYLGGKYFACRQCSQLAYRCQRETVDNRLIRKVDKLREKLDWEPGILNEDGLKPKGMHWKTFRELRAQHDVFAKAGMDGMMAALDRASRKIRFR
jgi:hypothetical protein